MNSDSDAILKFIQQNIVEQVNSMIDHIDKNHVSGSGQEDRLMTSGRMIFLGRFFQAIPELCPYLEKCITAPQTFAKKTEVTTLEQMQQRRAAAGKVDPKWTEIKSKLESESIRMFKVWIKLLNEDLRDYLSRSLAEDDAILVQIIPAWDNIEISEEAEEGVEVKSKILVPQHPSMAWFCALSDYCQKVYNIAPYSLPSQIQLALSQDSAQTIVNVYDSVSKREKLAQKIALQLHFDIQLVQQSLITRENRDLSALAQSVISGLENHIDPFDLSVFSPYMALHVKKTILRESGLLSVLIPQDRYTLLASIKSSLATSNPSGASSEQHNTMWMLDHK